MAAQFSMTVTFVLLPDQEAARGTKSSVIATTASLFFN